MDILKMVAELRRELEHVDQAILSLERIQQKAGQPRASKESQPAEPKPARSSGRPTKKKVTEDDER